ncbi:hypothetical protein RJ640_000596 [Escallonia rubra]|uniref:Leucine-rich repeat-containing N-terminal plant-type domain-containing protein n=1 Tax=Escallonia rubra TaxID=112253 RepID=A0AA88RP83_9ASTE|nr:hypothetical protein RJ640_000596 [Escallonia rubra]
MGIKSSLDPENKYLASWTSDDDPCTGSFEGVACNLHNKVGSTSLWTAHKQLSTAVDVLSVRNLQE